MIQLLYNIGRLPLVLLLTILNLLTFTLDRIADGTEWLLNHWRVLCRRWSGLDAQGRTKATLLAIETKRYDTLIALGADPFHRSCGGVMTYGPKTGLYYCGACGVAVEDDPDADIRQVVWKNERRQSAPTPEPSDSSGAH